VSEWILEVKVMTGGVLVLNWVELQDARESEGGLDDEREGLPYLCPR